MNAEELIMISVDDHVVEPPEMFDNHIPAKYKELMGLVVSAGLRCDDCIIYHIIQSYRLGANREEQQESLNVALVVGGSIVIPHLRRAYALLEELYS